MIVIIQILDKVFGSDFNRQVLNVAEDDRFAMAGRFLLIYLLYLIIANIVHMFVKKNYKDDDETIKFSKFCKTRIGQIILISSSFILILLMFTGKIS